jgi:hypothetical protein
MKISYSVEHPTRGRRHFHEIELLGYYGVEAVINDLDKILEFHGLRCDKHKREYIEKWGQESYDKMIELERGHRE